MLIPVDREAIAASDAVAAVDNDVRLVDVDVDNDPASTTLTEPLAVALSVVITLFVALKLVDTDVRTVLTAVDRLESCP